MSSSRLPGKSLMPLVGRPVVWHVFHRLKKCNAVDEVVLATSDDPTDDELARYAEEQRVRVVRGPLDNVLQRYVVAAEESGADYVVRVTGDAPLIDPAAVDRLVELLISSGADYSTMDPAYETIHLGFEPFTAAALARLWRSFGSDPASMEHVTPLFRTRPGLFTVATLTPEPEEMIRGVRVSVDTPADLRFLEAVYERLGASAGEVDVRDVVRLLCEEPALLRINSHVRSKPATERSMKAALLCDGGREFGLGHVRRCLAVAEEMRERHAWGVVFLLRGDQEAEQLIQSHGHRVYVKPGSDPEDEWFRRLVDEIEPDAVVCDTRSSVRPDTIAAWRKRSVTAALDDSSERRLAVDLAFYPPVPQAAALDWDGAWGTAHVGWEWVVLGPEFGQEPLESEPDTGSILVAMGGADPQRLTERVVGILEDTGLDRKVDIAIGSAVGEAEELAARLAESPLQPEVHVACRDMRQLYARALLCVCTYGVTAYELAAMAVPVILLSLDEDHRESASALESAGMAVSLGVAARLEDAAIAGELHDLVRDERRRESMAAAARDRIDTRGAERVARAVVGKACGREPT